MMSKSKPFVLAPVLAVIGLTFFAAFTSAAPITPSVVEETQDERNLNNEKWRMVESVLQDATKTLQGPQALPLPSAAPKTARIFAGILHRPIQRSFDNNGTEIRQAHLLERFHRNSTAMSHIAALLRPALPAIEAATTEFRRTLQSIPIEKGELFSEVTRNVRSLNHPREFQTRITLVSVFARALMLTAPGSEDSLKLQTALTNSSADLIRSIRGMLEGKISDRVMLQTLSPYLVQLLPEREPRELFLAGIKLADSETSYPSLIFYGTRNGDTQAEYDRLTYLAIKGRVAGVTGGIASGFLIHAIFPEVSASAASGIAAGVFLRAWDAKNGLRDILYNWKVERSYQNVAKEIRSLPNATGGQCEALFTP